MTKEGEIKMTTIALIDAIKLSDNSKVYNVVIRNGGRVACTLECESRDAAMEIADAVNTGTVAIK